MTTSKSIVLLFRQSLSKPLQPLSSIDRSAFTVCLFLKCRFCDILTPFNFQDSWLRDGDAWAFHASAEVALKNLSSWVDPFPGRGSSVSNEPFFDTDLYTIHTLRLTSTIHLHFDSMSPKISNAASELLGLINFLNPGDYCYLDPILAVGFYCLPFIYL